MKDSKECAKPPPPPRPNLKNKDFVKWSKGELCRKEDNIVSTEWHEKLQRTNPFVPAYDNAPLNMNYLLSGEYGRIWQKERDEWYSKVFVLKDKEKDMDDRKKKIRKQIREAKKAAEVGIKEWKERRAKEAELKAKAEAERYEKLKAKVHKDKLTPRKPVKPKKKHEPKPAEPPPEPPESSQGACPKGWTQVELTMQCECSDHKKETNDSGDKGQETERSEQPTMCQDYMKQLQDIQESKSRPQKEVQTEGHPCEGPPTGAQ